MFFTNPLRFATSLSLLARRKGKAEKKVKAALVLVECKSVLSSHNVSRIRPRLDDKLEFIHYDPFVQRLALYKEEKKLKSCKNDKYLLTSSKVHWYQSTILDKIYDVDDVINNPKKVKEYPENGKSYADY